MVVRPEEARGGTSARFKLPIRNGGNRALDATVIGEDSEDAVRFSFQPAVLFLEPGQEGQVVAEVSARPPRRGPPLARRLTFRVEAENQTLTARAMFTQAPAITKGRAEAWRMLLGLAAAALLVIASFLTWTDTGLQGLCVGDGECLSFDQWTEIYLGDSLGTIETDTASELVRFATSAGIATARAGLPGSAACWQ
jgi:hypothetical protein